MLTALQHFNIFFNCQLQKWHKEVRQGAHSFYTFLSLTILLILSMTKCIILMLIVHLTFYLTTFFCSNNIYSNKINTLLTKRMVRRERRLTESIVLCEVVRNQCVATMTTHKQAVLKRYSVPHLTLKMIVCLLEANPLYIANPFLLIELFLNFAVQMCNHHTEILIGFGGIKQVRTKRDFS